MPDERETLLASLSAQMASLQTILDSLIVESGSAGEGAETEYLQAFPEWAPEKIYKIKNGMPITDENANAAAIGLLKCIKWLGEKIEEVEGAIPGTERFEQLYDQLKELDVTTIREDLEYVRRRTELLNRYQKDKFWDELFSARNSFSDVQSYEVEEAVRGSDCIDLYDTSPLIVGRDYIIKDETGFEEIRVKEILTTQRFKVEDNLKRSYAGAKLYRTTFAFADYENSGGLAYAHTGDTYFSKPIHLNASGLLQNVYIGRDTGEAVFKIYYKDESDEARDWTELESKANILRDSKTMENIFTLPAIQGVMELKIVCESGSAEVYYVILHLSYVDEGSSLTTVPWGQISGQIENQKDLMDKLANAGSIATTEKHGIVKLAKIPVEEA